MDLSRFSISNGVASLVVKQGTLLIDEDDLILLQKGGLNFRNGYAILRVYQNNKRKRYSIHRLIMNPPCDLVVDHINHNTLDNRKCNLRICTRSQNCRNNKGQKNSLSKHKGVIPVTGNVPRPWRAYTRVLGKRIWLGYYATEDEAGKAYNDYAQKEFGEFAYLNDI